MGANLVIKTFKACDQKELSAKIREAIEESQYMDGHDGYSGDWGAKAGEGVEIVKKTYVSADDAEEDLCDEADNRGPILVAKVLKSVKVNTGSIDKKIDAIRTKLHGVPCSRDILKERLAAVRQQKSEFKSCPDCKSRISVKHLNSTHCPVCVSQNLLMTAADKNKLASNDAKRLKLTAELEAAEKERNAKISEAAEKPSNNQDWYWFAYASCPS